MNEVKWNVLFKLLIDRWTDGQNSWRFENGELMTMYTFLLSKNWSWVAFIYVNWRDYALHGETVIVFIIGCGSNHTLFLITRH
jgi:hypothetical protein